MKDADNSATYMEYAKKYAFLQTDSGQALDDIANYMGMVRGRDRDDQFRARIRNRTLL